MKTMLTSMAVAILIFSSCRKEGPQGPVGPQGPQGNANVTSETFTVTPGQWQINSTPGQSDHLKFVDFSIAGITQSVIDNGAVIVYSRFTNDLIPLPFSYQSTTTQAYYTDDIYPGGVEIQIQLGNFNTPTITANQDFKIVVINGSFRLAHPEINWKNPTEVMDLLHLEKN
jgi:hypothetical protein